MNYFEDSIFIQSTSDSFPESCFLKNLFEFKKQSFKYEEKNNDDVLIYPFKLENKYYNANIKFITLKNSTKLNSNLIDKIQSLVILFDPVDKNSLDKIKEIKDYFKNCEYLQEKLLICKVKDINLINEDILDWCCSEKFEFINYGIDKQLEDEDNFLPEKIGLERFLEILDTHSWDNYNLNQNTETTKTEFNFIENLKKLNLDQNKTDLDNDKTFEELFSEIQKFKEKADQLEGDEKYNYAEKVANAFLKSLGEEE